jgi:two-component system sensor histidine kinase YesM
MINNQNMRTSDVIEQANDSIYLDTLFNNLITIREEIWKIHIFDTYGLIYNKDMKRLTDTKKIILFDEPWYETLVNDKNSLKRIKGCISLGARLPDYFRTVDYLSVFEQYHFSIVREINTFSPYETIGYIELMAPVSVLQDLVSNIKTETSVILLDQFANIVYEPTGNYLGAGFTDIYPELSDVTENIKNYIKTTVNGVEVLATYHTSDVSGWSVVSVIPVSVVKQDAWKLRNIVILASCIIMAIAVPIIILLAQRLSKPIMALSMGMRKVRKGDPDVTLPIINNDEIGWLTEQFNRMTRETRDANQKRYEAMKKLHAMEMLQKETELLYLRNQINPHFLYNNLDSIRITAAINNDNEVADIIYNLAQFFRMSISKGSNLVPLRDEINLIKRYMSLMKLRYKNNVDVYEIEEAVMDKHILNFILQPVVENSIIHGLSVRVAETLSASRYGLRARINLHV